MKQATLDNNSKISKADLLTHRYTHVQHSSPLTLATHEDENKGRASLGLRLEICPCKVVFPSDPTHLEELQQTVRKLYHTSSLDQRLNAGLWHNTSIYVNHWFHCMRSLAKKHIKKKKKIKSIFIKWWEKPTTLNALEVTEWKFDHIWGEISISHSVTK